MEHKKQFALILVSALLVTIVVGRFKFLGTPVSNVSAVTVAQNLGVYWDENCSRVVDSIDWGVLSPGEVRDVVVHVRNEGNESVVLVLTPLNWSPENASRYLSFTWICEDAKLEVGQNATITQTLTVDPLINGIYNFSFNTVFEARAYFFGDINRDGSVDTSDLALLSKNLGSTPADSDWNPKADLNEDGIINIFDIPLIHANFGES